MTQPLQHLGMVKQPDEETTHGKQQISLIMNSSHVTAEHIAKAGVQAFVMMYGGKENCLRYAKFMEMSESRLNPQKLPPTEREAHFPSLRVHLPGYALERL